MIPSRLLQQLRRTLHFDDPPWRLAFALAAGVFISFTPFYGLQTLLAIGIAIVLRLNRAATVAGAWLNLPWFAPLVYGAALKVGTLVVPDPEGIRGAWIESLLAQPGSLSWRDIPLLLDVVSLPFFIGTTLLGTVAALATYVIALAAITRHRARQRRTPR